jgi:hypothetical protein
MKQLKNAGYDIIIIFLFKKYGIYRRIYILKFSNFNKRKSEKVKMDIFSMSIFQNQGDSC